MGGYKLLGWEFYSGRLEPITRTVLHKMKRHDVMVGLVPAGCQQFGSLSVLCQANTDCKHRKNCECCHHHSVFKGHNVIVHIVVLNCQKCNQCLKSQVSGHKNFQKAKNFQTI